MSKNQFSGKEGAIEEKSVIKKIAENVLSKYSSAKTTSSENIIAKSCPECGDVAVKISEHSDWNTTGETVWGCVRCMRVLSTVDS
ncbi:hypothetical protein SAMN05421858_3451 [Haladaptatus litoreus]|uniref:Uncharacterized protein n=2 Tax=Haladaptatus litoreus TaxID=553468 RepID=A0A1N7DA47_9EURY|nr:hypothetical protein SAMN05421858_3451 [Haladaptatus litoreus]